MSDKELPEKTKIFYTPTGFGVKKISKEAIRKNLEILRHIAKQAKSHSKRE